MGQKDMEGKVSGLLEQFALTWLSVELLRLHEVREYIPRLDEPGHRRGVDSIGIKFAVLAQASFGTKRSAQKALKGMMLYAVGNLLGDAYEVVKDHVTSCGKFDKLRSTDKEFFNYYRLLRNALKHNRKYGLTGKDLAAEWTRTLSDGKKKTYSFDLSKNGKAVVLGDFGNLRGAMDLVEDLKNYALKVT